MIVVVVAMMANESMIIDTTGLYSNVGECLNSVVIVVSNSREMIIRLTVTI